MTNSKRAKRVREEQRFVPRPTMNPMAVKLVGALGAFTTGAGAWAVLGNSLREIPLDPLPMAPGILAAGVVLSGIGLFVGTSREAPLRVGDAGVATERNELELRRIPWYAVDSIRLDDSTVVVSGKDETGAALEIRARVATQPDAAAWIVREGRSRIPRVVSIDANANLPEPHAGERLLAESLQVVGRRCAVSGRPIAFEPDARVCLRCERVYEKGAMPGTCACGAEMDDETCRVAEEEEG